MQQEYKHKCGVSCALAVFNDPFVLRHSEMHWMECGSSTRSASVGCWISAEVFLSRSLRRRSFLGCLDCLPSRTTRSGCHVGKWIRVIFVLRWDIYGFMAGFMFISLSDKIQRNDVVYIQATRVWRYERSAEFTLNRDSSKNCGTWCGGVTQRNNNNNKWSVCVCVAVEQNELIHPQELDNCTSLQYWVLLLLFQKGIPSCPHIKSILPPHF